MFPHLATIAHRIRNLVFYGSYIPTEFFVLDDKRLVYVSIPKVACTSIKTALFGDSQPTESGYEMYMDIHRTSAKFLKHHLNKKERGYYKFAFVRNPLVRLISCYKDKVIRPIQHNGKYYFDSSYNNKLIHSLFGDKFRLDMSFDEFVALVARIPDWLADGHFRSQYSMLAPHKRLSVDYIGRFEQMEHDWDQLAQAWNLSPLNRHNPTEAADWTSYFSNSKTLALAKRRYYNDLTKLGYQSDVDVLA